MAVKPPMIKSYAEGNYNGVLTFFNFSNKAIYYSLLLIVFPLFYEMGTVLKIWLDVNDAQTILFCRLILIYVLLLALNNPISIIVQANGNIKAYSTFVEIPTLLVFPVTWALFALGLPAETAFYVMIVAVVFSHLIRLVCLKKLFPVFSYKEYLQGFVIPAIIVSIIIGASLFFIHGCLPNTIARLFVMCATSLIITVLTSIFIGFDSNERKLLISLVFPSKSFDS